MRSLPSGTVTFLFTDIEGSTQLLQELGAESYAGALAEHRRALRDAFESHGGVEIDTQGDAFFIAFGDAAAAVLAAREAQAALRSGPIRVRMGLHTGRPHVTNEGYVGQDVHLGARIAGAGHGGQVLMSRETRQRAGADDVLDLGEHRLKDFADATWIYQLGTDPFPPLRSISNTNLPRPTSSFMGREREVQDITALLSNGARMVTLTGPGGTGKTRLAIESATELIAAFRNGVFWIDLATVRDPAQVPDAIGATIGAKEDLGAHIGTRQMLLVLDNLEQVVEAGPELARLVTTCPGLRILQTSREVLRVRGEVEYAVSPLASDDAARLFAARSAMPVDEHVVELCRRLDNLPLAVELAAARTSVLSPRQIVERIGKRLDLLRGGRDVEPRQQTLRATIEWSHDLLSADEQRLFRRLSVFASGWTLDAAEVICGADLDVLQSLVDKSLVQFEGERFSMLETIRDFAGQQLAGSAEANAVRRAHAEYFAAMAAEAEPHVLGTKPFEWLDRLDAERANIAAALDALSAEGETQPALAMAGALWEFWCLRAHYTEGLRHLGPLLERDNRPTLPRAKALTGIVHLAYRSDRGQIAAWADEAVGIYAALGDAWGTAFGQYQKAAIYTEAGQFAEAVPLLEDSVERLRAAGDEHRALLAMRSLAWSHEELGDTSRQKELTEEILVRARATEDRIMEGRALAVLAGIASDEGRHADALELVAQVYHLDIEIGDPDELNVDLVRIARIAAKAGDPETAVRLLSVRAITRPDAEAQDTSWVLKMQEETLRLARASLDDEAFDRAWQAGRTTGIDQAVSEVLNGRARVSP